MKELSLVYVYPVGHSSQDVYEYEFFFSETPEVTFGDYWYVMCPAACGDVTPEESSYSEIRHLKTDMKLICAQENTCFSMQDCIDGCIALCFQDINGLEEYPEHRFIVPFGEKYSDVVDQLHVLDLDFEEDKPGYVPPEKPENEEDKGEEGLDEEGDYDEDGDNNSDDDWDDDRYPLDLNF